MQSYSQDLRDRVLRALARGEGPSSKFLRGCCRNPGKHFRVKTKTTVVSRYGCSLPLPRLLRPEQEIFLRRVGTKEQATARVVAPLGPHGKGFLYGVGMDEACEENRGISLPIRLGGRCLFQNADRPAPAFPIHAAYRCDKRSM